MILAQAFILSVMDTDSSIILESKKLKLVLDISQPVKALIKNIHGQRFKIYLSNNSMIHRIASSIEDLPDMRELISHSGLEFMQNMIEGKLPGPPIGHAMNFKPIEASFGRVVFEGVPGFKMTNPMRGVHGGWYGAILDSCMSCAVMSTLEKGKIYTTLEFKVNITRPIPVETRVIATGEVQHHGRSTGVARGEIRCADGSELYATGSTTCIVMDPIKNPG